MKYNQNEIPHCPNCGAELDTYVCPETSLGVQNMAVQREDASVSDTCFECHTEFTVKTIKVNELYEVE